MKVGLDGGSERPRAGGGTAVKTGGPPEYTGALGVSDGGLVGAIPAESTPATSAGGKSARADGRGVHVADAGPPASEDRAATVLDLRRFGEAPMAGPTRLALRAAARPTRAACLVRRRVLTRPAESGSGAVDAASSSTTMTSAVEGRPHAGEAVASPGAPGSAREAAGRAGLADAGAGRGAEIADPGGAVASRPAAAAGSPASDGLAASCTAGGTSAVDGSSRGATAGEAGETAVLWSLNCVLQVQLGCSTN
ncbi:uncharacterized protein KRP23_11341 [Phytophthora ramorum]|uniref:uncharacterized protein n=1 Tax=Phytophthora ramorum TaxID=164328 RepID=UPI0030A5268C|nr:hypothetical protein KRP23_15050 [Phytophthora ramorum]KAH7467015.1 hypothetical protein KRP23_11341 [Phytophthora ramorum]